MGSHPVFKRDEAEHIEFSTYVDHGKPKGYSQGYVPYPNCERGEVMQCRFIGSRQVTIIFVVSVGLSVCLFVCAEFFSAVFDPISIKLGHMLYVWV